MALRPETLAKLSPPTEVSQLGVPEALAEELYARRVLTDRSSTIAAVARDLCISPNVSQQIATSLREKALLEFQGMDGRDYKITLTEQGRAATNDLMKAGRHVAAMPVPLATYRTIVEEQRPDLAVDRAVVKQAFSDLVIEDSVLDQIGPAFVSGGPIFFYGPPGTGKTSLAERMGRFHQDYVLIPRFVSVDGDLIAVYDPAVHVQAAGEHGIDPRWVVCERPLVVVGGELTLPMMDLQHNDHSGLSSAPIQMLANNGILVIDDFGRQAPKPDEILNRWILPLSRGYDFLRPKSGSKVTVPFEIKLIVSTNLEPTSLGDDAFLRRLRNKVYVGPCSETAFNWILVRAAEEHYLEVDADSAAFLSEMTRNNLGELRPYVAIDFCELAGSICDYDGLPRVLDKPLIRRVGALCFVNTQPSTVARATSRSSSAPDDRRRAVAPAAADGQVRQPVPNQASRP